MRAANQTGYAAAIAVVALGAAGFAIAFRGLLHLAYSRLFGADDVLTAFRGLSLPARLLVPIAGGMAAGVSALIANRISGTSGVGDVMESVAFGGVHISLRAALTKAVGSLVAIVGGGSVGREGPLIQFGGAWGEACGSLFRISPHRARVLVAAGTAAGFAAAYNTPLAAILFVLEIVAGVAALDLLLPVVAATTLATLATRAVAGPGPIYGAQTFALVSNIEFLAYATLGVAAALAGQGLITLLAFGERAFEASKLPQPWRAAIGASVVGLIAIALPEVVGNGYEALSELLAGRMTLAIITILVVAKAVATVGSVSSGSPGGVFTPSLLIGAAIGALIGTLAQNVLGSSHAGPVGAYALVGMAAMTASTTHAPVMAAVLVFELSGDYAIVLPLLLATTVATALSRRMREDSIYAGELRRRGIVTRMTMEGRQVSREKPIDR